MAVDFSTKMSPIRYFTRVGTLIPLMIGLVFVFGMARLGFWQLSRATEKEENLAAFANIESQTASTGDILASVPAYYSVELKGNWLPDTAILLDNVIHNKQEGVYVYVPFRLEDGTGILVNRGWLSVADKKEMPSLPVVSPDHKITGKLAPYPKVGFRLGKAEEPKWGSNQRQTYLEYEKVESAFPGEWATRVLLLEQPNADGLVREWNIAPMPPEKNRGYAFQWFSMSTTLMLIITVLLIRDFRKQCVVKPH